MTIKRRARAIAFYLPQFHPIPENDEFWGKGFTEWTNVTKAKPLFRGHKQPHLPADLGLYDLRVPEIREQQADLARYAGIEGFCYWHYWFGNGRRAMERVFNEVLETGRPDFPFCLAWANESWTGRWHGLESETIIEQTYPGEQDYKDHFYTLLPAFKDHRYISVDGKTLFVIYLPHRIPDLDFFTRYWNELSLANGLRGFYFVAFTPDHNIPSEPPMGISGMIIRDFYEAMTKTAKNPFNNLVQRIRVKLGTNRAKFLGETPFPPLRADYCDLVAYWSKKPIDHNTIPCVHPNWDNTARCGTKGLVVLGSTPGLFEKLLSSQLNKIAHRLYENRLIFIKSWNEWAEGNYLEPDQDFGRQYLDAHRNALYRDR